MANENYLVMVPVFLALILIFGLTSMPTGTISTPKSSVTSLMQMPPPASPDDSPLNAPKGAPPATGATTVFKDDSTCSECISAIADMKCTDTSNPVLGGVDVVNYFTVFKLADGTYDESQVGVAGSSQYSATYLGYDFYFVSEENKKLFESSPAKYAPQYGGFCSWGMSTEFCPKSPWSTECLGPYGNWAHWTIQNEKLYFFWFGDAKSNFQASDITTLVATADQRWYDWYGDSAISTVFSTNCYSSIALPDDSSLHPK